MFYALFIGSAIVLATIMFFAMRENVRIITTGDFGNMGRMTALSVSSFIPFIGMVYGAYMVIGGVTGMMIGLVVLGFIPSIIICIVYSLKTAFALQNMQSDFQEEGEFTTN